MAETFFGTWSLLSLSKDAAFQQRVRISGSENSDGNIDGVTGQAVAEIRGGEWTAEMEWSSDGGVSWNPSAILRTMEVTDADGIIVTLGADDNEPELRDGDFNDLVAVFKYLDPEANPPGPPGDGFDFTIPRGFTLTHEVSFDFDSATVKPLVKPSLAKVADVVRDSDAQVTIVGHTDSSGSQSFNQQLSEQRAQAVRAELVRLGVPAIRLTAIGRGESEPRADNSTENGRVQNRRVEILVQSTA